jgi:hypothetical protein
MVMIMRGKLTVKAEGTRLVDGSGLTKEMLAIVEAIPLGNAKDFAWSPSDPVLIKDFNERQAIADMLQEQVRETPLDQIDDAIILKDGYAQVTRDLSDDRSKAIAKDVASLKQSLAKLTASSLTRIYACGYSGTTVSIMVRAKADRISAAMQIAARRGVKLAVKATEVKDASGKVAPTGEVVGTRKSS